MNFFTSIKLNNDNVLSLVNSNRDYYYYGQSYGYPGDPGCVVNPNDGNESINWNNYYYY